MLWVNVTGPSGEGVVDRGVQWTCKFLAQNKFMPILACLFGAGLALQWERIAESGRSRFLPIVRRLLVLFVFGASHLTLVWDQDFLTEYALWGVYLVLLLRLPPKAILWVAALVLAGILVRVEMRVLAGMARAAAGPPQTGAELSRRQEAARRRAATAQREIETGTWFEHARERGMGLAAGMTRGSNYVPRQPLVLMLVGVWIVRRGLMKPGRLTQHALRRLAIWSLIIGLSMSAAGLLRGLLSLASGPVGMVARISIPIAGLIGANLLGLAYASVILLLLRDDRWRAGLSFLAPVGRMALTNYLLQTLCFTWLVYGYGLGLYSAMTPPVQFAYAVMFFGAQIALSGWWLSRFCFGPAEWLWRSMTYATPQPWRVRFARHS